MFVNDSLSKWLNTEAEIKFNICKISMFCISLYCSWFIYNDKKIVRQVKNSRRRKASELVSAAVRQVKNSRRRKASELVSAAVRQVISFHILHYHFGCTHLICTIILWLYV